MLAVVLLLSARDDALPWPLYSCVAIAVPHVLMTQELGAMQQQATMDVYEDPSLEDLRAERV